MKKLVFAIIALVISCLSHNAQSQWQVLTPPLEGMDFLMNMHFVNDSTGFVLQKTFEQNGLYNRILKTTDYGDSWDTIHNVFQDLNLETYSYRDIFFINEQIGWICGSNMPFILKTIDGGQTWQINEIEGADAFYRIEFADEWFGIAFNGELGGSAIETIDGGLNWNLNTLHSGYDGSFLDQCTYLTVRSSAIHNYQECNLEVIPFPTINEFGDRNGRCIYMKNANEWIVGSIGLIGFNNFGSILSTSDGGNSFTILDLLFSSWISDLYFLDINLGFATAVSNDGLPCSLLKTTNGGISWSCQETPIVISQFGESYYAYFYDMDLRNENLMYAMDQKSIYRTTNGGGPLGDTYTGVKVLANKARTLNIYPNPTSSIVRLELSDACEVKAIEIYNSVGQQVEIFNGRIQTIDVGHWPAGCYTVVVRYEDEVVRQRLVVE